MEEKIIAFDELPYSCWSARFILEPDEDYQAIVNHGSYIFSDLFMEYGSSEVAAVGILKWARRVLNETLKTNQPIVVETYAFIPKPLRQLPFPGKLTKARVKYFLETCRPKIHYAIVTGEALRLYQEGKNSEAMRVAFEMKKGA